MSYKPDEKDWMAYVYGELEGTEKERFEQFLLEDEDARKKLSGFNHMRSLMSSLEDKEVIAPPIVLNEPRGRSLWDIPYWRTISGIAAAIVVIMVVAKLIDLRISATGNEVKLSFGEHVAAPTEVVQQIAPAPQLTASDVEEMISRSLDSNNMAMKATWDKNQERLTASIRENLAVNSNTINSLVREASTASQDQIRQYVSSMQAENMQMVKDYFQLTSTEQKKYVENLLVDFASYLQQQRNNDLQLVETRLKSLQQNTDNFKQETEQILTSIITTVGASPEKGVRN